MVCSKDNLAILSATAPRLLSACAAVALLFAIPCRATGFFRAEKFDGRAWIVDPDGSAAPFLGIDHVRPFSWKDRDLGFDVYGRFVETNYPTKEAWIDETVGRLRDWGFNTLANHCDEPLLRHRGLAHTITLYLGGKFARGDDSDRWIAKWAGPCTGFPNVFNPDFERVIRERAQELCAPHRDDPDLMGWFLDNELKWWGATTVRKDLALFDAVRALPPIHSARKALDRFLASGAPGSVGIPGSAGILPAVGSTTSPAAPGLAEREAFLALVAERYFSVLCAAIREADPNHMILGCRFAAPFTATHPVVWEAAGRHCDIVSFNYYPWADIDRGVVLDQKGGVPIEERMRAVHDWCGKPLVITEWSFPALDAGRNCFYGAGQRFPTQDGRAAASALYARTLLSLPFVAGYSYFMFLDQPRSGISATFREDSNYGLVNEYNQPYEALAAALRDIQRNAAAIHAGSVAPGSAGILPAAMLSSAPDGGRPRLSLGGVEVGGLGALLQWRGPLGDIWTHATEYAISNTPQSTIIRATSSDRAAFAITIRTTPSSRQLRAEILSVENLGDLPLEFSGVFLVPMPPQGASPEPVVPNLWGAPERAWWRNPDGTVWGAVSCSPTAAFRFWDFIHGKKEATVHADARFTTGPAPVTLAPGEIWYPPVPMEAGIGLRDDFPKTANNPETRKMP